MRGGQSDHVDTPMTEGARRRAWLMLVGHDGRWRPWWAGMVGAGRSWQAQARVLSRRGGGCGCEEENAEGREVGGCVAEELTRTVERERD